MSFHFFKVAQFISSPILETPITMFERISLPKDIRCWMDFDPSSVLNKYQIPILQGKKYDVSSPCSECCCSPCSSCSSGSNNRIADETSFKKKCHKIYGIFNNSSQKIDIEKLNLMSLLSKKMPMKAFHKPNYEKNRMKQKLEKLGECFEIGTTEPYKWMIAEFGRIITQKEFNSIYLKMKASIPGEFAPNRDVNRSQILRFEWLSRIWWNVPIRETVKMLITSAFLFPRHDL